MKTHFISTRKSMVARVSLAAALATLAASGHADLNGPYTADTDTLYLFHFDGTGVSVTPNAGTKGGNAITVTNDSSFDGLAGNLPQITTLLGHTSYAGFGNALSGTNFDGSNGGAAYDGNADGQFTADQNNVPSADEIAMTNLNFGLGSGNSPWTIEALIRPSNINNNQEIVCTDGHNIRGFQFRLSGGQLEFNNINTAGVNPKFPIPTSGTHAFVANTWYHVALTYDGANLRMFWTKLDPAVGAANQIGSQAWVSPTSAGTPLVPFTIGDEARGGFGEPFLGLIDEVRISRVARAANEMQFFSPAVTISGQPASQNIDNAEPVTFEVLASSTTTLGYRWRFNGTPIAGSPNSSTYSIPSVDLTNAGNYDVVITNQTGSSATSEVAVLTVGAGNFLAHRWSFTTDTSDSIGGATGINQGNATVSGGALVLDGTTNTYMALPSFLLSGLTAVTFDFWATFGENADNNRVFDFGNTNFVSAFVPPPQNYVFFSPRAGGGLHNLGITGGSSESQQTLSGTGILDGQTVHVTCVVDPPNGVMSIYTNGVLEVAATNLNVSLASLSDELCWIGRSLFAADPYLNGSIDELRIYNGALAPASIRQSELAGPDVPLSEGPVQLVEEPVDTVTAAGQMATFSGAASGHLPITYQWYENGAPISGATNVAYAFVASGGQDGNTFQLRATNNVTGTTHFGLSSNATLTITIPEQKTWIGTTDNKWNISTLNWSNATSLASFNQFDLALFDSRGSAQPNVDVVEDINLTSLTVNSATDYLLASTAQNGSLNGNAPLVKQGTGKLTVDLPNNLAGGTLIQSGTLQIGNGSGSGTLGGGIVTNNAALTFNRTNTLAVPNDISGSGRLSMIGSGNVVVSGSNSYSGLTLITNGTLNARNASALGSAGTGTVATNGGQLFVDVNVNIPGEPLTLGGDARAALHKGGGGTSTLGGAVNLVADTMIQVDGGATLNLANSAGISGSGVNLTLAGGDLTSLGTVTGPVTLGAGSLTNAGGAWRLLRLVNSYSGKTHVTGGRLEAGAADGLGTAPGAFTADQINLNGGTLGAWTNFTLNDGLRGITVGPDAAGGVYAGDGATFTILNDMAGFLPLTKSGPGTVVLEGTKNFFGQLFVGTGGAANDGILRVDNAFLANIPSPIIIQNDNAGQSTLQLDGSTASVMMFQNIDTLAGRNNSTPAIENFAGTNTIFGSIAFAVGGGQYRLRSSAGLLIFSGALPSGAPAGSRTVYLDGTANMEVNGSIQDGGATVSLTKEGTGTVALQSFNNYSGLTTVSDGVLMIEQFGSINSTGTVTVAGGALAGTGTINANVTIQNSSSSGTIDSLIVSGSLTLSGPLAVDVNRSGFQSDHPTVSGAVSNTGTGAIVVNNLGAALQVGDTFTLFDGAVANGAAMGVSGAGVVWNNNLGVNGSISVSSTTVPQPQIDSTALAGGSLILSGSSGPPGGAFELLSSTNVADPLPNWPAIDFGVFDGSGNFSITNILTPGEAQRFYLINIP